MKSTDPILSDFSSWQALNEQTIAAAPVAKAVYLLRKPGGEKIRRLKGESDVLFIGSTKQPLRRRLAEYTRAKEDEGHDYYVKEMAKRYRAEISWRIHDDPRGSETYLLGKYLEDHDELPPLNAQKILSLYRALSEGLPSGGKKKPSMSNASLNAFLR